MYLAEGVTLLISTEEIREAATDCRVEQAVIGWSGVYVATNHRDSCPVEIIQERHGSTN